MKTRLAAVFTLFSLALSGAAGAGGLVISYDSLVSALSGYHEMPGEEYWDRLEPEGTRDMLMKMVDDQEVFTPVRARAMRALVYYSNGEVNRFLADRTGGQTTPYLRSSAYEALAVMKGPAAAPDLARGLEDGDIMVRLTAVRNLRKLATPEARKALEMRLGDERNPTARYVIEKSLEQMD